MQKRDLKPGDLIAFRIGEEPDFSAPNKDAWGVIKILETGPEGDGSFLLSVKAGLWADKPGLWQAFRAPILIAERFAALGTNSLKPEPVIFSTPFDGALDLTDIARIGRVPWFSRVERQARRAFREKGYYYVMAALGHAPQSIDHEHRAREDAARWQAEVEAYSEKQRRLMQARQERAEQRLKGLTLAALRAETPFQDWDNRTQIVPPAFTAEIRQRTHALLDEVLALGDKPGRKALRGLLKAYVLGINEFNGAYGYAIETEEREDLMRFVEELCWAAKQKPLIAETDDWRDW